MAATKNTVRRHVWLLRFAEQASGMARWDLLRDGILVRGDVGYVTATDTILRTGAPWDLWREQNKTLGGEVFLTKPKAVRFMKWSYIRSRGSYERVMNRREYAM